jgi:drug/metabolite transporter (DMT)-like permease
MEKNQLPNHAGVFLTDKKTGLLYSLYLAIGSVSLFASMVALNTAYQGYIWSYSSRYIINSFTLAFALFLSGALLIVACYKLQQKRSSARLFGLAGVGFLVGYSLFILIIDRYIAYTLVYVIMLLIVFILILVGAVFFFSKKRL